MHIVDVAWTMAGRMVACLRVRTFEAEEGHIKY